jgi:hypothetical protein
VSPIDIGYAERLNCFVRQAKHASPLSWVNGLPGIPRMPGNFPEPASSNSMQPVCGRGWQRILRSAAPTKRGAQVAAFISVRGGRQCAIGPQTGARACRTGGEMRAGPTRTPIPQPIHE